MGPLAHLIDSRGTKKSVAGSMGNRNSGQTMAYFNMQKGESPYLKYLADQYTMSDNYHQPVMGGTSPESLVRVDNFSRQLRQTPLVRLRNRQANTG